MSKLESPKRGSVFVVRETRALPTGARVPDLGPRRVMPCDVTERWPEIRKMSRVVTRCIVEAEATSCSSRAAPDRTRDARDR